MYRDVSRLLTVGQITGWKFDELDVLIQQGLCEALYAADRIKDVVECFRRMLDEFGEKMNPHDEHLKWALGEWSHNTSPSLHKHFSSDFRQRSANRLEHLADAATDAQRYDEAISHYTIALSLDPPSTQGILTKRTKAFVAIGSWKLALDDVNQVRPLFPMYVRFADPSSSGGYKDLNVSCRM